MAAPRNLLIVRLSAMGDILHSLPAAVALRHAFPEATLGWVVEERWVELLSAPSSPRCGPRSPGKPIADKIHTVNTKAWRQSPFSDETWREMRASLREIRAERYEVAVDVQGAIRSALIARWSGAPTVYGFAQPRENAASLFYNRQVQTRGVHIVEQNLSLATAVAHLSLTEAARELSRTGMSTPQMLPVDQVAERESQSKLQRLGIREYAILNPGAGWGAKQWPAGRYGVVAQRLAAGTGLRSVINAGPEEQDLARAVEVASQGAAISFSGSISELIALTRGARLFIGGDTGPMHLAAALGVPVVGIFGPTDPARNGPYGTRSVALRSLESITSHKRREAADEGMLGITPEEVVDAALHLLKDHRG
jgi:heptosyltransferase I